jgi:transcriptional regulator with XRE-family HTH domain
MQYGNRIAQLRDRRGYTQEELAGLLGISRAALSHYEKNRRKPDFATLTKIADLFQVSVDYLVGRTQLPEESPDKTTALELSDEEILNKFTLTIDGRELTTEEAKRFIAFVRAERSMK